MIIGPFTLQSRGGMQSFQMLNHAISPCNFFFFLNETILFSVKSFIHCLGPCSPLWCRRWQAKEAKSSSTEKKPNKKHYLFNSRASTLLHNSRAQSCEEAQPCIKPKTISEENFGRAYGPENVKTLYKPSFVKPSHVKAGSRTELVVDHHPIIWVTPGDVLTLPPVLRLLSEPEKKFQTLKVFSEVFLVKVVQVWSSSHHTCAWVWLGWAQGWMLIMPFSRHWSQLPPLTLAYVWLSQCPSDQNQDPLQKRRAVRSFYAYD